MRMNNCDITNAVTRRMDQRDCKVIECMKALWLEMWSVGENIMKPFLRL
jgi:hypothetical protein